MTPNDKTPRRRLRLAGIFRLAGNQSLLFLTPQGILYRTVGTLPKYAGRLKA